MEGVGARDVALKLFVQLLGCSRSGGAVVRAGAAEPSGTGRSARSGREEPQSEEGEEEEEKEEKGPRWRLGSRKPGSWTGEAAVCTDSLLRLEGCGASSCHPFLRSASSSECGGER